jgi:predicted RNase H-like HicB family nuclease
MAIMEYVVVIERGATSYGAYIPDLAGCVAVGDTEAEAMKLIREAIEFHLEGMRLNGETIPQPTSHGASIGVAEGMEYAAIIEPTSTGFSAYLPNLPGCVAAAETEAEVWKLIREAVLFHLEQMRLDGDPIPPPTSRVGYVEVPEPASVA